MRLFRRHLRLFGSDPVNWIVSFLSVAVILSLYFLFIRDFTIKAISDLGLVHQEVEEFVDLLMISGLLIVIVATSCLPISAIAVKDRERNIIHDFEVSPISRFGIHASYLIASIFISMLLVCLVFFLILIYFYQLHDFRLSNLQIMQCLFILLIACCLSSLMLYLVSLPFKSMTSFTSFGNLFGVMIGFLTGVYIPIGYYPQVIQNGIFAFPLSLTTSLLRNIMTNSSLTTMTSNYPIEMKQGIQDMFGMNVQIQSITMNSENQLLYCIAFGCFLLFILVVSNKMKKLKR